MAGTKGEEAIVEGHEEVEGRKRVDDNTDARPAKRAKVEGNKAADCRNLGEKEEREAVGDGTGGGEEEELKKKKVDRLCRLLEDKPKMLNNRDVEDVIWNIKVDKVISLATKSDQGNGMRDYWYLQRDSFVPSHGKVLGLLMLLICGGIEKLEEVDLFILYQNFPRLSFGQLLLSALDSYTKRFHCGGAFFDKEEERVMISRLCCAVPWKLFAYVMYDKTSLPQFKRSEKEEEGLDEERTSDQKKAAESCEICYGKGKHGGVNGYHCSFWYSVPSGLNVGPSHRVLCRDCGISSSNDFVRCYHCGSRIGQAEPISVLWDV